MRGMLWTPEQDDALRALFAKKLAYASIGERLGGLTKNAVCGRIKRLGLAEVKGPRNQPRMTPEQRAQRKLIQRAIDAQKKRERRREAAKTATVTIRRQRFVEKPVNDMIETALHLSLIDLQPHHCRYPYSLSGGFTFCGHNKAEGSSYCAPHAALCTEVRA